MKFFKEFSFYGNKIKFNYLFNVLLLLDLWVKKKKKIVESISTPDFVNMSDLFIQNF